MKLELAWQGFRDFDSINRSGDAKGARETIVARQSHAGLDNDEKRITMWARVEDPRVQGVDVEALGCT